jgi:CBS domain containing-hemolysin-like protein
VWDVIHTFILIPAGAVVAYAATNQMDASVGVIATLLGGGLAFSSHGTKAALRAGANLLPEPVSNWILSCVEDVIAIIGSLLAVFAPVLIAIVLIIFMIFFVWFFPKVLRAMRRIANAMRGLFAGESFKEVARKAS